MKYEINGTPLPALTVYLENGETVVCENGAMSWMSPNLVMETTSNGGIGKAIGRMFTGEAMFQNRYTAQGGNGMITMASSFPGSILPFQISPGNEIIVQKSGFLASEVGVTMSVAFQKKLSTGIFGGEGFIMQRLSGNGLAFVEIDGHCMEYTLGPGESMILDNGYLAAMSSTCTMDIQTVKGVKNVLLGGEGLTNVVVTGPGKIYLQTIPVYQVANAIRPYIPTGN